ncbi:hypothetical protein ACWD26_29750 [Streptomyces sp. NPDC002787]
MIRTTHRTKGPGVLGAEGPGRIGPFGRWPDDSADEHEDQRDDEELPAGNRR